MAGPGWYRAKFILPDGGPSYSEIYAALCRKRTYGRYQWVSGSRNPSGVRPGRKRQRTWRAALVAGLVVLSSAVGGETFGKDEVTLGRHIAAQPHMSPRRTA